MAEAISTDDFVLLAWGANSYGQLGIGSKEDTLRPAILAIPSDLVQGITHISGGGGHTVIVSGGGKICGFGWNKCGQIGHVTSDEHVTTPEVIPMLKDMKCVSCGWTHSLLVNGGGEVAACGSNAYGQLGTPDDTTDPRNPTLIPRSIFSGHSVIEVAAGLRHSIALTDVGGVYTWGNGRRGQLGHGKEGLVSSLHTPRQVNNLRDINCIHIRSAAYTSFIISESGCVYSWGCNQYGQCTILHNSVAEGLNHDDIVTNVNGDVKTVLVPYMVKGVAMVTNVQCGWSHVFATNGRGEVCGWGRCDYGQLGRVYEEKYIATPTLIPELYGAKQIACGSEHNIAINSDNKVVCWGWNEHGMCGTGDETNVTTPTILTTPYTAHSPILVGAGAGHSLLLTQTSI